MRNWTRKPELAILKGRNGVLPLLHCGQWPRLYAARSTLDKGTAAWGQDHGGDNRGTSVSEGIRTGTGQTRVLDIVRVLATTARGWQGSGSEIAALRDIRGKQ